MSEPKDNAEPSGASGGSVCEPVAYQAVDEYGRPFGYAQIILPFGKWPQSQRVALYLHPQPALTDAERRAVEEASEFYIGTRTGVALRGLLERLG